MSGRQLHPNVLQWWLSWPSCCPCSERAGEVHGCDGPRVSGHGRLGTEESEDQKQFGTDIHYIFRPQNLHESRDVSWLLSVDAMTALECICRSLGPHIYDIANFLINHGVPFQTFQPLPHLTDPQSSSSVKQKFKPKSKNSPQGSSKTFLLHKIWLKKLDFELTQNFSM